MDYCLVLQNDETGKQRGLCWAATCATMIRYSTGNRSIESFQIANEMGIGYDVGADIFTMRQVLINHGCTIQYQALNRKAISITEVMHNINNQYPLAMVGTRYNNGYPIAGHAVTIIGYNGSNLIYWNSASGQMKPSYLIFCTLKFLLSKIFVISERTFCNMKFIIMGSQYINPIAIIY